MAVSSMTVASPISSSSFVAKAASHTPSLLDFRIRVPYARRSFTFRSYQVLFGVKSKPFSNGIASFRCFASALTPELRSTLDKVVTSHKVVLFMKGTKEFPQCGFSNTVVQILHSLNVPFETINILENEMLRQGLKEYSNWPTFPQLYIEGDFFGGCDITVEAYKSGQLQELLETALCS